MKYPVAALCAVVIALLVLSACGQADAPAMSVPKTNETAIPTVSTVVLNDVPTSAVPDSLATIPVAAPTGAPYIATMGPTLTSGPSPTPYPTSTPIVVQTRSTPVEIGVAYPYTLYTHCGTDFETDFNGVFWDAQNQTYDRTLGNPSQDGTMTLIDNDHARFDWTGGSLYFNRHIGPKIILGACG